MKEGNKMAEIMDWSTEPSDKEANNEVEKPSEFSIFKTKLDYRLTATAESCQISIYSLKKKEKQLFLNMLKDLTSDQESMNMFKTNIRIKSYLFNIISSIIEKNLGDDILREILKILSVLLDEEYDHENKRFFNPTLIPMYGEMLIELIPLLTDLGINESFYSGKEMESLNEKSDFQNQFLALANYVLKTVELRSIVSLGMKPKHLQFLIIHFTSSNMIPEILLSVSENLSGENLLYAIASDYPEDQYNTDLIDVYTIVMNSAKLLTKLYLNDFKILKSVKHMNILLAKFGKEKCIKAPFEHYCIKNTHSVLKELFDNLKIENDSRYRALRYQQINIYLQLFSYHFDNLNDALKQKWSKHIVALTKKILNRITSYEAFRKLFKSEIAAKNLCFSLIIKLIENDHEIFFLNYCKDASSKIYFQPTWLHAISNKNEFACMTFISFIRMKAKGQLKDYSIVYDFTRQVTAIIQKHVNISMELKEFNPESEFNVEAFSLYMRVITAIADYYSANLFKSSIKNELMPIINNMVTKLQGLVHLNINYLNLFLQFQVKLFQCLFTTKTRPTALMREHVMKCIQIFEDMVNFNFVYTIKDEAFDMSLEVIGLIIRYYSVEKIVQEYNSTLFEMLLLIDNHLNDEDSIDYQTNKLDIQKLLNTLEEKEL